jgi:hypothetical protein
MDDRNSNAASPPTSIGVARDCSESALFLVRRIRLAMETKTFVGGKAPHAHENVWVKKLTGTSGKD